MKPTGIIVSTGNNIDGESSLNVDYTYGDENLREKIANTFKERYPADPNVRAFVAHKNRYYTARLDASANNGIYVDNLREEDQSNSMYSVLTLVEIAVTREEEKKKGEQ